MRNLASVPLGLNEEDDFCISIAGAQEKTDAVTRLGPTGIVGELIDRLM